MSKQVAVLTDTLPASRKRLLEELHIHTVALLITAARKCCVTWSRFNAKEILKLAGDRQRHADHRQPGAGDYMAAYQRGPNPGR